MTTQLLFAINKLCYSYGQTAVIKELSGQITAGKFYGIIGPNGCGKTTFLDLLAAIKSPQAGEILFNGRNLGTIPKKQLARSISLVPQEYNVFFSYTVEEIVFMGRHPHMKRFTNPGAEDWNAVNYALKALGIDKLRHHHINKLSGGQKQRVIVARAIAQQCPVILLDEATSSLDINFTIQIFDLVKRMVLREDKTAIAVIHDLNLAAAYCDHLVFINDGQIRACGATETVCTEENIRQNFGVQSRIEKDPETGTLRIHFGYNMNL